MFLNFLKNISFTLDNTTTMQRTRARKSVRCLSQREWQANILANRRMGI